MTRLNQRIGRGLLLLAFLLFAAVVIHPFVLGGGVRGGKVEDGRYFVVAAGHRYAEVTKAQWRIQQFLELGLWLPVVLTWMGLAFRDGPGVPRKLTSFLGIVGAVGTASAVLVGLFMTGDPWNPVLIPWLVLWGGCFLLAWWQSLRARPHARAEPGAAPNRAGM
jgi:hypothetical protein